MRITRFLDHDNNVQFGLEQGDGTANLLARPPLEGEIDATGKIVDIQQHLAPIEPTNIFCIGLNYRDHAAETNADLPEHPVIFMKPTSAVTNPDDPIILPACCTHGPEVDYECELAVIIGKTARNVSEKNALEYVLGYTCANDVSARRWQKHAGGGQWVRGKSFDTFCPLGPVIVTTEELEDPQNLHVKTELNGKVMQDHHTSDMIFTIAQIVSFLSMDTTLLPGTVILTGTPAGVGVARDPKVFLHPEDVVTVSIENIGELTNPVQAAAI